MKAPVNVKAEIKIKVDLSKGLEICCYNLLDYKKSQYQDKGKEKEKEGEKDKDKGKDKDKDKDKEKDKDKDKDKSKEKEKEKEKGKDEDKRNKLLTVSVSSLKIAVDEEGIRLAICEIDGTWWIDGVIPHRIVSSLGTKNTI